MVRQDDESHLLGGLSGLQRLTPGVLADGDIHTHDITAYGTLGTPDFLDVGCRHMSILELWRTDEAAEASNVLMCLCGIETHSGLSHRLCKYQGHHEAQ